MNVLVLSAGSEPLNFEVISAREDINALNSQPTLVSGAIEKIGALNSPTTFPTLNGKEKND
jgi:hypothetical protein